MGRKEVEAWKDEQVVLSLSKKLYHARQVLRYFDPVEIFGGEYDWTLEKKEGGLIFFGRTESDPGRVVCVSLPHFGNRVNLSRWREIPDGGLEYDTPLINIDLSDSGKINWGVESINQAALTAFDIKHLLYDLLNVTTVKLGFRIG